MKMISLTDEDATSTNKTNLESKAKQDLLDKQCETWTADLEWDYTKNCDQSCMDKITFTVGNTSGTETTEAPAGETQADATEAATDAAATDAAATEAAQ